MPTPANSPAGATGPGAVEKQDTALFSQVTERQELPQLKQAFPGFKESSTFELQKVGVISQIRLIVELKYKVTAAGVAKLNPGFPWSLIKKISISANGVTGIISCRGVTIESRRRRIFRNPVKAIEAGPKAGEELALSTEHTNVFTVVVPIAHDMLSILGSLLAQNEETALAVDIDWASEAEVFSGAGGKVEDVSGSILWDTTTFSIGQVPIGNKQVTVLPDMSAFHGLIDKAKKLVGTGEEPTPITRTVGQLLCFTASILNGPTAQLSPKEWDTFSIEYGANKKPRVWRPAKSLIVANADDYDGPIDVEGLEQAVVDNEVDNPTRDMIYPEAMTELQATVGIPAATTLAANAETIVSNETLYPSR